MADKPDEVTPIVPGWVASANGRQKLALALIGPAIALLAYSFLQILQIHRFLDGSSVRIEAAGEFGHTLERDNKRLEAIHQILLRSFERSQQKDAFDFAQQQITKSEFDTWYAKVTELQVEMKQDRGRLDSFVGRPNSTVDDVVVRITSVLDHEGEVWASLLHYLEELTDENSTTEDKSIRLDEFKEKSLGLVESLASLEGAALDNPDDFGPSSREKHREFQQLKNEIRANNRLLVVNYFLFILALAVFLLCTAWILRLQKEKRAAKRQPIPAVGARPTEVDK